MKISSTTKASSIVAGIALVTALSSTAVHAHGYGYSNHYRHWNHGNNGMTIYFTRHAEKETVTRALDGRLPDTYVTDLDGNYVVDDKAGVSKGVILEQVCGDSKCAEVLSKKGETRAMLLADWFGRRNVSFDAVYATHKLRTQQTVMPTATANGLPVIQLPEVGTELNPQGTTPSECATLEAINAAYEAGLKTILVAGHSGTLYDIMGNGVEDCSSTGLGLNTGNTVAGTGNTKRFPKDSKGKVANFGDIWKVKMRNNGKVVFKYRKLLDFTRLSVTERAR